MRRAARVRGEKRVENENESENENEKRGGSGGEF